MTKRAFYRCPIKAAYMAKYHGIQFDDGDSFRSACEAVGDDAADTSVDGAFYLHPDSMGLLEPREGDKDEDGFRFEGGYWVRIELPSTKRIILANQSFPAKRNGQPFIWPEWEA